MKEALKKQEPKPLKAFRDKYLAVVMMVAALLISSVASAQTDSLKYSQINGYGFKYKRMAFDSVLMIPQSNSPHAPYRRGALRYRASDSTLQLWTGYQWNSILTGVGNGVDTAYMINDSILTIETPDQDYFLTIPGRHWTLQGILNNGSTLTENEIITLADSLRFTSGMVIIDTLNLPNLVTQSDTTANKPVVIDASGNVHKMVGWPVPPSIDTTNKWINNTRRRSGTDSVEIFKNGSWQFAYPDSTGGGATLSNVGSGYRLVKTADGQVKTIFVGYGLDADSTTNTDAITIKGDTSELVTPSDLIDNSEAIRARYNTPPTESFGEIYHKDRFTSTSDITPVGTFSASYSGGAIGLSGGSGTFANYGTIGGHTMLPQWSFTTTRKVTVVDGSSFGFGQGVKSTNSNGTFDVLGRINTSTAAAVGTLYINKSDGTQLATGAGPSISAGDVIELVFSFNDSIATLSARNITTSSATSTIDYTFSSSAPGGNYVPNTGKFALYELGGTDSLYTIDIRSSTPRNSNAMYLTDSKGIYFAQFWATRTGKLLNATYPTVLSYCGGSDGTTQVLQKLSEITKLNPAQVVMNIGSNDLRYGSSLAQLRLNYDSIVQFFKHASVPVYHVVLPEDSTGIGIGLSDFKQWVAVQYASDYIDVWTQLSTSNILKAGYQGDGVHPNQAAMKSIDSLIVLSGKLGNTNDRTYQIRTTDGKVRMLKDSLYLDPSFTTSSGSGISGLSTNVIPKATSSTTIGDGSITDGASLTTLSNPVIINSAVKIGASVNATDAAITINAPSNLPSISFYRSAAPTDHKIWNWYTDDDYFTLRTVNDALNASGFAIQMHRSGNSVDFTRLFGNVGIGKDPSVKLDVDGAGAFNGNLSVIGMIESSGTGSGLVLHRRDTDASAWGILSLAGNLDFFDQVAAANKFTILPGGKLHIYDTVQADARISYNSDIHSSFTPHSLVCKDYVDAAIAAGGGNGIYGGNGSLPSTVTVTGGNNSLTFDDIFAHRINSDYNVIAKANGTGTYTEAVIGTPNIYEIGFTPTVGVYSKGAGVFIDTNNNVGVGTQPPTAMPLYATGASLFVQGFQSNQGNFSRVDNVTTTGNIGLTSYFITIDATAGNVTLTLPAASTAFGNLMGIKYKFQRIDASGNTVTIQRAGSDTINGGTSFTITTQYTEIKEVQCTSTSTWAQW